MTEEVIRYLGAGIGIGMLIMGLVAWYSLNKLAKEIQEDQKKAIPQDYAKHNRS